MKTLRFAWYLLMLSAFAACSNGGDDNNEPTPPQPDKPAVTFPTGTDTAPVVAQTGGTSTLNFTATQSWTATIGSASRALDWISVSPTSGGAGNVTLKITTQPNDTPDERNAAITINSGGQVKTVTVSQKQKDALTVTSNKVEVKAEGGDFTIEAKANVSVSYEIGADAKEWIKASSSRGLTTTALSFTAETNGSTEKRQGTIVVKGDGGLSETVTVYQAGEEPTLVLTENTFTVPSKGDTLKIELQSNTEYQLELPDVSWIREAESRTSSTYTHYIVVQPNDTYDERNASLFVVWGDNQREAVTITQKQLDALLVTSDKVELACAGGEFTVEAQANVSVDFEIDEKVQSWLHANASRGLTSTAFTFTADANESLERREGNIYLKSDNGLTETVTVYQAGEIATLVLTQSDYVVSADGDTLTVELKSNVPYEVVLPKVDWLTESASRSVSAYTHRFVVAPNEDYDARSMQIVFRQKDGELADTVTVEQMQRDAIVFAHSEINAPAEATTLEFTVGTNVDFTVSTSADWLKEITTRGLVERRLQFSIAENTDTLSREATITLAAENVTQNILIKQAGKKVEPPVSSAELVKIEYRRGWRWDEAHHNLPLLLYPMVHRDCYYSNDSIATETLVDYGHRVEAAADIGPNGFIPGVRNDLAGFSDSIVYKPFERITNDSVDIITHQIIVPDLSLISSKEEDYGYSDLPKPGEWTKYVPSKLYNSAQAQSSVIKIPNRLQDSEINWNFATYDWEKSDYQDGWYIACPDQWRILTIYYNDEGVDTDVVILSLHAAFHDQFLSIDGLQIDFLDYLPEHDFNLIVEDIPSSGQYGPGKKFTYECKTKFYGRNFYIAVEETVYERKK